MRNHTNSECEKLRFPSCKCPCVKENTFCYVFIPPVTNACESLVLNEASKMHITLTLALFSDAFSFLKLYMSPLSVYSVDEAHRLPWRWQIWLIFFLKQLFCFQHDFCNCHGNHQFPGDITQKRQICLRAWWVCVLGLYPNSMSAIAKGAMWEWVVSIPNVPRAQCCFLEVI